MASYFGNTSKKSWSNFSVVAETLNSVHITLRRPRSQTIWCYNQFFLPYVLKYDRKTFNKYILIKCWLDHFGYFEYFPSSAYSATGALHNSKKNRNNYACAFYFVDCYWLKFLMLTHNTPEMCTLCYFNSNVKMFPHTSGHSRHKNAYLSISLPKLLKRIFSLVIGHIFHLKFSAGSL